MAEPRDDTPEGEEPQMAWTPWLRLAREAAKFWGLGRVPRDLYREQWAVGNRPEVAVKQIMLQRGVSHD